MHLWMVLKNRWSWRVAYNIHCVHRGRHDVAISISFFRHVVHSDVATKKGVNLLICIRCYLQLVRRVWIRWLERCEEREDGDMVAERQKARHHYYKSLMMKAWWAWTQYVEWRRHRKVGVSVCVCVCVE
jgi:hypothetical protein